MKPGKSSVKHSESLSVRVVMDCSVGVPVASECQRVRYSDTLIDASALVVKAALRVSESQRLCRLAAPSVRFSDNPS
jgi:hypothetical protein